MALLYCLGQVTLATPTRKVVSTETAFPDSLLDFLRKRMDGQELEDKLGKMRNQLGTAVSILRSGQVQPTLCS